MLWWDPAESPTCRIGSQRALSICQPKAAEASSFNLQRRVDPWGWSSQSVSVPTASRAACSLSVCAHRTVLVHCTKPACSYFLPLARVRARASTASRHCADRSLAHTARARERTSRILCTGARTACGLHPLPVLFRMCLCSYSHPPWSPRSCPPSPSSPPPRRPPSSPPWPLSLLPPPPSPTETFGHGRGAQLTVIGAGRGAVQSVLSCSRCNMHGMIRWFSFGTARPLRLVLSLGTEGACSMWVQLRLCGPRLLFYFDCELTLDFFARGKVIYVLH